MRESYDGDVTILPTKQLIRAARILIDDKLSGDARNQALRFTARNNRTARHLLALIKRLEALPDVERDGPVRGKFSFETMQRIRAERAAGATLQELADKHGVVTSTIHRICADGEPS